MWKRTDGTPANSTDSTPEQSLPAAERQPTGAPRRKRTANRDAAVIGPTVTIKGEIVGEEDIHVLGRVEGSIKLEDHNLVVGESGEVSADITARQIEVEGQIDGDINGIDKIIIRDSGRVRGNIRAPKVVLEEGSQFKGAVEMDVESGPRAASKSDSGSSTPGNVASIGDTDKKAKA